MNKGVSIYLSSTVVQQNTAFNPQTPSIICIIALICIFVNFIQGVEEADRPEQGFYIRSGITVILEKATIEDGTVI